MDWDGQRHGWSNNSEIFMLGLMCLIMVALAVWLIYVLGRRDKKVELVETPRQILDRRFVGGEIDAKTYEQIRKKIESELQ
jgi:uncharacterized membrane protein